jgi:hypothetical protein
MGAVERAYRNSTRALGLALVIIGVALVVTTLARGGGPLATGVVLGVGLAGFGGARLYLAAHTPSPGERA